GVRAVGELDRSGAYLDDGFPSAAAWVRERCRLSHGAAHATVTLARKLTRLAETSHAFARLCQLALDRGEVGTTRGVRPHISVVVDLAELEGRGHAELVAAVRCDAEHLGRLSRGDVGPADVRLRHQPHHHRRPLPSARR